MTIDELIQIAAAGGGLDLTKYQNLTVDQLIDIAAAASNSGARVHVESNGKTTDEMIQIASKGNGAVLFV